MHNPLLRVVKRLLTTPESELTRWQTAIRYLIAVGRQGLRQLREDRAGQMAAALSFRTIFGLIPVLALSMVLFQAFGRTQGAADRSAFQDLVLRVGTSASLDEIFMPGVADENEESQTVLQFISTTVSEIENNISFSSIGLIGILLLAWASVGLLTAIERTFNTICRVDSNRSIARRFPLYWMVLTIGPGLLYLSFFVEQRFSGWVSQVGFGSSILYVVGVLTSFGTIWLFMLFLYSFMPNVRLPLRAASIGAVVSALLFSAGTNLLTNYLSGAFGGNNAGYAILYRTLGLIPLLMMWVYFMWGIILFGLEVASTLKHLEGSLFEQQQIEERPQVPPMTDPVSILPIAQAIAHRFENGDSSNATQIAHETQINAAAVVLMLQAMGTHGILHAVNASEEDADPLHTHWSLAKPPSRIPADQLLEISQQLLNADRAPLHESPVESPTAAASSLIGRLHLAQRKALAEISLSQIE